MLKRRNSRRGVEGFTLAEALVVLVMAGVLAAIAAPSWLAFLDRQRVSSAQDQALQAMRSAQAKAVRQKQTWEAGFRQEGDRVQWSVYIPSGAADALWQDLIESDADKVQIVSSNLDNSACSAVADYCIQFQDRGVLDDDWQTAQGGNDPLGQITFTTTSDADGPQRCVVVATLLGSLRTGRSAEDGCG